MRRAHLNNPLRGCVPPFCTSAERLRLGDGATKRAVSQKRTIFPTLHRRCRENAPGAFGHPLRGVSLRSAQAQSGFGLEMGHQKEPYRKSDTALFGEMRDYSANIIGLMKGHFVALVAV